MVRKCDTEKYRRRRAREKLAHAAHVERRQRQEREWRARVEEEEERRRQEWLADPRRQKIQELVNVLAGRLYADPTYRFLVMERVLHRLFRESGGYQDIFLEK